MGRRTSSVTSRDSAGGLRAGVQLGPLAGNLALPARQDHEPPLRFAEAVACGHPDRLADLVADRIVAAVTGRDADALVGVEVALFRDHVFVTGQIAAGAGGACAITEAEVVACVRGTVEACGYGCTPAGFFPPDPAALRVTCELELAPLGGEARGYRRVSDDQVIAVGHAVWGPRARHRPLEQALANEFVEALEGLRRERPELRMGPDGKVLVAVRGRRLAGVSVSVHHLPQADWIALTTAVRAACEGVARSFVEAGELEVPADVDWLVNGAGAFEVGGPFGDNGLSGKKLVAQASGTAVPIGGGATFGKDRHKPDVRSQHLARLAALALVESREVDEATVWLAWRPGDTEPRWIEVVTRGRGAKIAGRVDQDRAPAVASGAAGGRASGARAAARACHVVAGDRE